MRCLNMIIHALLVYQYILQIIGCFHLVAAIGSSDNSNDNLPSDPSLANETCQRQRKRQRQRLKQKQKQKKESENVFSNETFDDDDEEEHRYIVSYKKNASSRSLEGTENNPNIEVRILKTDEEIQQLEEDDNVEYVEKDHRVYSLGSLRNMQQEFAPIQLENYYKSNVFNTEYRPYGIDLINASPFDSSKVSNRKVCIIDTGYELGHPDLQTSNIDGYSGSYTRGPWDKDGSGHGTHVAGTIAALGGNGQGVVGVVPNGMLNIYIVRIFDNCGDWAWGSDLISAVYECVNAGSNVINMSLGTPQYSKVWENKFRDIYEKQDVLLVAAAGNNGNSTYIYPAALDSVMGVAAVTENAERADFSQRNDQVDIAGPGKDVLSTLPSAIGSYGFFSGTSMASPYVAGVAALVWSHFDTLKASKIREALESSAIDLGSIGRDDEYGHGLVNTQAAYQFLVDIPAPSSIPSINPTLSPSLSVSPTSIPTVSQLPSPSPSSSPTSIPTSSHQPSSLSEMQPTSTNIFLGFHGFFSEMDSTAEIEFERITEMFLFQKKRNEKGYLIKSISVNVLSQKRSDLILEGVQQDQQQQDSINNKELQGQLSKGLVISLMITTEMYSVDFHSLQEAGDGVSLTIGNSTIASDNRHHHLPSIENELVEPFPLANTVLYGFRNEFFSNYKSQLLDVPAIADVVTIQDGDAGANSNPMSALTIVIICVSITLVILVILLFWLRRENLNLRKVNIHIASKKKKEEEKEDNGVIESVNSSKKKEGENEVVEGRCEI